MPTGADRVLWLEDGVFGELVGMAIDEVCGMPVERGDNPSITQDGRTWWFCSTHCRDEFVARPRRQRRRPEWESRGSPIEPWVSVSAWSGHARVEPVSTPCTQPLWSQERGDGPSVLLIHGLGASAHYWDGVMAATGDRRMLAPDLLGFGRSPSPPDASYDVECHLAALQPLLGPGTVVVGHSTGGILAAALAALRPDAVRALVLIGLPAFPDAANARAEVGRLGLIARLTVQERPLGRWLCVAMCRFRPVAIVAAPLLLRGMPRAVAADGARHTWPSYSRTLRRVVVEHPVWPDLAELRVPITFLHGRQDRTAPLHFVEVLADRLRGVGRSISVRTTDGDHHLPVRQPALVAEVIADLSAMT